MKNGQPNAGAIKHATGYVNERLAGSNKQDSAIRAGYSESSSRKPSLVENTLAYALIVQRILFTNSNQMADAQDELRQVLDNKPVDWVKAQQIANFVSTQTKIHDILTPKITVKETKDAQGNITRQSWGTNGAVMADSE